jgi:mRNA interferase RelE/StbE
VARVELTDDALEDLRDLDNAARKIILKALRKLERAPNQLGQPLGSRPSGNLTGFHKLVVGRKTYRIIYLVHDDYSVHDDTEPDDATIVVVWVIAERADSQAYELAVARLKGIARRDLATELERMLVEAWPDH